MSYPKHRRILPLAILASLGSCTALDLATRGPHNDTVVETLTLRTAPVSLSVSSGHEHAIQPAPLMLAFPEEGWIHGFDFEVVDASDRVLPRELVHHLKVMAPDKRELFSGLMLRVIGAGRETESIMFPTNIGYRLHGGDPLLVTAMLHNPTERSYAKVRVRIRIHYSPRGSWTPPLSIYPFSSHVTVPGKETSYDLPPGRSIRSIELQPAIRGRILALGGHLHRYGVSLRLESLATGEVLWEKRPAVDEEGEVLVIPHDRFIWSGGLALDPDVRYRFTAAYDNPTDSVIPDGGMATLGGIFLPEDEWPGVDKGDPAYLWDWSRETGEEVHGAHH